MTAQHRGKKQKDKSRKVDPSKREILDGGKTKFKKQISESSKQYLLRQAKDPYSKQAIKDGYRSRAAYKLMHINEKANFIKPGMKVVDLGAAPGGWCQVLQRLMAKGGGGRVVAIDKIYMDPVEGCTVLKGDFTKDEVYEELLTFCPDGVDVVLSDMAPETIGHSGADHLRCMALVELAFAFALETLKPGGTFLTKIFQGGEEVKFRNELRQYFEKVSFQKPPSSRKESREIFVLAQGFKGNDHQ